MGYRRDIGAVISVDLWTSEPETDDIRDDLLNKYKKMVGLIKLSKFYELMQQAETDRNCVGWRAGEFYFHAENWKWYPDYDIVQAWEELWEQMQDIEGVSGYFARVGEEVDDIVQESWGDNPDYDAFYPCSSLMCEVIPETFGNGDIDKELEESNIVSKEERDYLCMDNNAIQA